MAKRSYVEKIIKRLKQGIEKELDNKQYCNALSLISICANVLYISNLYYTDKMLEDSLQKISNELHINSYEKKADYNGDKDIVLFFDGFGENTRGLIQIYLKALCRYRKVVYVTYDDRKESIPDVHNILTVNNGKERYIKRKNANITSRIESLNKIVKEYQPVDMFFYSVPSDVVATTIMYAYDGLIKRYQINLTDHAFWLGTGCIDCCIEFREYGASISANYRGIENNKLVMLPYYPIINKQTFQGYPFPDGDTKKFVFSGGSLYKTLSKDNLYYKIVDYLLCNYRNVLFWYAGDGDESRLNVLKEKYPDRVYHTHERTDFYEIIKRSYFYLSTYPVCGGLMFQYVAKAGKIPLTLRYDAITDDFLFEQDKLNIQFDTYKEVVNEIDHLMKDDEYVLSKSEVLKKSVIEERDFEEAIYSLLTEGKTLFKFIIKEINTESFRNEYINNFSFKKYCNIVAKPENIILIKYFSKEFFVGAFDKIMKKIRQRFVLKICK